MAKQLLEDKLDIIDAFLEANEVDFNAVVGLSLPKLKALIKEEPKKAKKPLGELSTFLKIDVETLTNEEIKLKKEELKLNPKLVKIRTLNEYLSTNFNLKLPKAISYSEEKLKEVMKAKRKPSTFLLLKIGAYFGIPRHFLINDKEELPLDSINLDERLISVQKENLKNELHREKNKRYFVRNWNVLTRKQKWKLVLTACAVVLPLMGYTAYCAYSLITDRLKMSEEFIAEQTLTPEEEEAIYEAQDILLIAKGKEDSQVTVDVALNVASITNVSNSEMSFTPSVELYFDFDHEDYFAMVYDYNHDEEFSDEFFYLDDAKYYQDDFGYNNDTGAFYKGADNVPDYMQIDGYIVNDTTHQYHASSYVYFVDLFYTGTSDTGAPIIPSDIYNQILTEDLEVNDDYLKMVASYPGEAANNIYSHKENVFSIGHNTGIFTPSTNRYNFASPYILTDNLGHQDYRYFQSLSFSADIFKVYDSPRYPLDSVSFTIPITSEKFTYEYLTYNAVDYIDLTRNQDLRNHNTIEGISYTCSIDSNVYLSGTMPGFKITTGYDLFNAGEIKDISKKVVLRYFADSDSEVEGVSSIANDPSRFFYYSEFQFIMRANRNAISLFLQAFINLFAVVIWIAIAFYDQTYHSESAIGMLGTGLFGAISSILVGLSMISEAITFSLITMINIFTLAVIIIMTVSSVNAKRAKILIDDVAIIHSSIFLRILFIALVLCTAVMFVGLPLVSYMFY